MLAPQRVQLKRRRDELPPDELIVQGSQNKRVFTQQQVEASRYVRQDPFVNHSRRIHEQGSASPEDAKLLQDLRDYSQVKQPRKPQTALNPRTFHLKRPASDLVGHGVKKQRTGGDSSKLATFIESKIGQGEQQAGNREHAGTTKGALEGAESVQKRPGRGGRIQRGGSGVNPAQGEGVTGAGKEDQKKIERLASNLHRFALDELAKDKKDKITAMPKLAPHRSRELHQSRMVSASGGTFSAHDNGLSTRQASSAQPKPSSNDTGSGEVMDVDGATEPQAREEDETMYVYDTYYLVPKAGDVTKSEHAVHEHEVGNVGYLVITDEDQPLWEMYMNEEDDSEERGDYNSDEDDENAEDYYGADYPEDELASDDEYGRGAYGYRRGTGSDDEQYDEDEEETTWSDQEELRMRNPFTQPSTGRLAKYLNNTKNGPGSEDGDG